MVMSTSAAGLALPSVERDFLIEVQKGNVPGHSLIHKFGRNDAVPNATWEFINLLGFTAWPLSAATTIRVKAGGDAADDTAGNGAREITVQGIDDSFDEVTEAVATAGVNASGNTTTSFWRVHRAWVSAAGTYGAANTAAVTIENSGGGTDLIQIAIEEGQTQFGGWTVPAGKTAYLLTLHLEVDAVKAADIQVFTRAAIDVTVAPVQSRRIRLHFDGILGEASFVPHSPGFNFLEKTDVWAEARGAGAQTEVSVDFELLIVDD